MTTAMDDFEVVTPAPAHSGGGDDFEVVHAPEAAPQRPTTGPGSDLFSNPAVRALMPKLYTTTPNGFIVGHPVYKGVFQRNAAGDYQQLHDGQPIGEPIPAEEFETSGSQGTTGAPARAQEPNSGIGDLFAGLVRGFSRRLGNEDVAVRNVDRLLSPVIDSNLQPGDQYSDAGRVGNFVGETVTPQSLGLMAATGGMGSGIAPAGSSLGRRLLASAIAAGTYTGTVGTATRASQGETPTLESVVKDIVPGAVAGPVGEVGGAVTGKVAQELPSSIRAIAKFGGGASTSAAANVAASATQAKMEGRPYTMQDAERDAILGVAAHLASGGALHDLRGDHTEAPNAQPDTTTPTPSAETTTPPPGAPSATPLPAEASSSPTAEQQIQNGLKDLDAMQAKADELLRGRIAVPGALESPHGTIEEGEAVEDDGAFHHTAPTEEEHTSSTAKTSTPPPPPTPAPVDRIAMKQELATREYPEGAPVHGTDISALPAIAAEGLQPGKTYQQGGSSDEGVVYGSKVKGGDPGLAASYAAAKAPNLPAVLVLKPHTEGEQAGPGNITLHSKNGLGGRASYVRAADVEKVIIPGQPDMTLPDAAKFAKKYMAERASSATPKTGRYELNAANSLPEAISGARAAESTSKPSRTLGGAPRAESGVPTPSQSTAGGPISGEPAAPSTFADDQPTRAYGAAVAKKLGIEFKGVQDNEGLAPNTLTFQAGKGMFSVGEGQKPEEALAAFNARFDKKAAPGASATPKGGGAEYVRSRPEPQLKPTTPASESKFLAKQYSLRSMERGLQDWLEQRDAEGGKNTLPSVFDESGNPRQLEHPILPPDALDGLAPTEKARLSKFVDEDEWSNLTKHMDAKQISRLQDDMLSRVQETKKDKLARAIKEARSSDDPRAKFMAHYYENSPGFGEKVPKQWFNAGKLTEDDVGTTFEIHGEKFRVEEKDGELVLQDHITIRHPEELGKIPVDEGSVKAPVEAEVGDEPFPPVDEAPAFKKTSGQQKGLLGEQFDGPIAGSKTASMFGDVRRGAASELEAKGNEVGQAKKDTETREMFEQEVPAADKSKGELEVGDKFPFPGSKPKDKYPVVTGVRLTPEGQRQYQVRFSEKTDAKWVPNPKPLTPPAGDEIGQRGLSSGPPGALQIAPLMRKARQAVGIGELRGLRERFAPIESKYGSGIAKAFIKAAAAPGPEAETLAGSFMRRAFGDAPDPEQAAREWLDRGRFYRRRDLQARLGATAGTALPDIPPADLARMEADPVQQKADALWNKEFAPLINDIRNRHGMIMNLAANDPNKFPVFINLPGESEGPEATNTRVNPNKAFNKNATGNTPLIMDPKEAIAAALRGHLATDYRQQLARVIDTAYSVPQNSVVPKGRRSWQATFRGRDVEVEPVDVAPIGSRQSQIRMVPSDIADQWNHIRQPRGNFNTLFDKAIQAGTRMATFGELAPHSVRVIAHVGARMAQSGQSAAHLLPGWLGSNEAAVVRMKQMVRSPIGETMQLLIDRSGSDRGHGFDVQPSQNKIVQWLNKPHNILFNPDSGVDPMARRVVADSYLRTVLGNDRMNRVEEALKNGTTNPARASKSLEQALGAKQFVGLGRRVNDTMGFANKQTRSDLLNNAARIFPFISSESGMIPREVGKLVNIDAPSVVSALQRGQWKDAALKVGASLANGALGAYIAANAFNYANTAAQTGNGKFLWDNDDGHKLDVWIANGWYLSNLDPTFSRASRLSGAKALMNGDSPSKEVGTEGVNEVLSSLATTLKVGFTSAMYVATGKGYAPYFTVDKAGNPGLLKTSPTENIPGVRNTATAITKGTSVPAGVMKDAAAFMTGAQLKQTAPAGGGFRRSRR
jgi:hypothetical protein